MSAEADTDTMTYKVVINHQEQYSIRPAYKQSAFDRSDFGKQANKDEGLAHIRRVWADMRSKRRRDQMA